MDKVKEETRMEDDGVIWERAYTVQSRPEGWAVFGPSAHHNGDCGTVFILGEETLAMAWAHRLNVAYNAGRNAARRK
jgi:hypothetical protein